MATSHTASVVTEFYRLLNAGDPQGVSAFVLSHFAEKAAATWPDSLPFGGTRSGRERLATFFGRLAATDPPRGGSDFDVLGVMADERAAAVRLAFDWTGADGQRRPNGAVEWWTFDDRGLVTSVLPYYWDAPAMVSAG